MWYPLLMAIKTSTMTATILALTESGDVTTLNKEQLDQLLKGGYSPAASFSQEDVTRLKQFTDDEVATLRKLAGLQAVKNLSTSEPPPNYILTSNTLAAIEQVSAAPEEEAANTFYVILPPGGEEGS